MTQALTFVTILTILVLLIMFFLVRSVLSYQRKKMESKDQKMTEVGFVVDTFHDLVSKLKEKERELEELRKSAEERAWSVELYNENILQSVPSGVVGFDREGNITKMNSAAEHILGMKESDVLIKKHKEVFNSPIADLIEKKETVERGEISYLTEGGKRIWLGLNLSPLKDSSENDIGRLLVFTDITELKAFQSQKDLRDRLSTLGEMSAGIAHELRNPLAVISGYTKMLSRKAEDSLKPSVEAISKEVMVMDRIITDFLSFAKPTDPMATEVDLKELIEDALSSLNISEVLQVFLNVGTLPRIRADEVLLRQAFTNLLQNAIDSMPDGGDLRINGFRDEDVCITITDKGHGIPENIRDKIFLPFYSTKERGTGLGLAIVHKIIVSHGGEIRVDTAEDGTAFTVRFPEKLIAS